MTSFKRWRERCGYSQVEAARALGVSVESVRIWDSGHRRGTEVNMDAKPPVNVRVAMGMLAANAVIVPWPE